jgi:hypothetical protein
MNTRAAYERLSISQAPSSREGGASVHEVVEAHVVWSGVGKRRLCASTYHVSTRRVARSSSLPYRGTP